MCLCVGLDGIIVLMYVMTMSMASPEELGKGTSCV